MTEPSKAEGPAALVAPDTTLTPDRIARFSRQLMLPGFGELAQRRLAAARVLVVGAGGLGSAVVPSLAGAGVGTIGIVDDDIVELSNLHRQLSHGVDDIGRAKVDSLAETVAAIDPECAVVRMRERLTAANIMDVLADYDLIVDGSDNFPTRYLTNDAAVLAGKPVVWGAILRYHGQVGVSWRAHGPTYRDLFPVPPPPDDVLSCELGGVLPSLCGSVGALMAGEIVKLITGIGELLIGRVATINALSGRMREITYEALPEAPEPSELIDYDLLCGIRSVKSISAKELAQRIHRGEAIRLVDVREPEEAALRRIHGSELVPIGAMGAGAGPADGEGAIVVYCERDPRSQQGAQLLLERGFDDVEYLAGGIEEFSAFAAELIRS